MYEYILGICYLIACVLFVIGLKMLSHPETARKGNLYASFGMGLAIVATILFHQKDGNHVGNFIWIFSGIAIGSIIGWLSAKKIKMTAMPQMVSMFNGMGGACSAIIGIIEFPSFINDPTATMTILTIFGSIVIGSISFTGSMVAFAKLNGNLNKDIRLPFYNFINMLFIISIAGLIGCLLFHNIENVSLWIYILCAIALVYGVLFVIPIGGADMPVVISLLNSLTGIAATFAGLLYGNMVMIVGGILVGSAGLILTVAMCKAMNRSLASVVFGAFGEGGAATVKGTGDKTVKDITMSDAAILMNYSKSIVIIPGYGVAVAQAQHVMNEFETILEARGVEVKYAIHPVAGRMPGHMNVLLAEANVPYSKLYEMDDINPIMSSTDVALVVGANDVVNPAANNDPSSPIYGMPIIEAERAATVIIVKRSMRAGYAGIDNELFYNKKTSMLFGDAKHVFTELVGELKGM